MRARLNALLAATLAAATLAACGSVGSLRGDALYAELGGKRGIAAIVDGLLIELARDERIVHHFADTDIARLRRLLEEQICEVSGGPCIYSGDSMRESHRGLDLTDADFNALVEDLIVAMEDAGVAHGAQNALLARLAPMHGDIVYR